MLNIIYKNIPLIISLISLILSLINSISNRKRLDVEIEDNLCDINDIYLNRFQYKNNQPNFNFTKGKICFIKIVNPSPKDISFFDLRVINISSNKQVFYIYKSVLESLDVKSDQKLFYGTTGGLAKLNYPQDSYGVLKANSFNKLDIAFFPKIESCNILISFKVAIPSLFKNKESITRKNFKYYRKVFKI
ncbi:hypothetical protein [Clostridium sp. 001]|uniref:hypothetical protein n=1 Tax=Clostridium sp. 001 TaxID=1970093 RepID=UPI001C2BFDBC|nr:hypothetical protein [Clostridium sp. 001]QXE18722.1 hypothetical protein B5S50_07655 [Clostridium sp. 001]